MWRGLGIVALVWIGLIIIGAIFKVLMWALVIGAVVAVGWVVFAAIGDKNGPKALR